MEGRESARQITDSIDDSSESLFVNRTRCCFYFRCFDRSKSSSSSPSPSPAAEVKQSSDSLWNRSVAALMKIREWSEIVAGPKWKTFIRRFNRNRNKQGNFQYDPLSYAMNFDEGPGGQNSHFVDEDNELYYNSLNFSSRYAKGSIDLGKEGTSFV